MSNLHHMARIVVAAPTEIPPAPDRDHECLHIRIHIHYFACYYPTISHTNINWKPIHTTY